MNHPVVNWRRYQWIHLTSVTEEDLEWLKRTYDFHDLDLEDCSIEKTQRPKWESYPDHSFFIFHFADLDHQNRVKICEMKVFISNKYIITIADKNLPVSDWFEQVRKYPKHQSLISSRPGFLLYQLVDRLTDQGLSNVRKLGKMLDHLDNRLLQLDKKAVEDISKLRRNFVLFSTTLKPMINIFAHLEKTDIKYLNGKLSEYWGSINDHIYQISDNLADYSELLNGLTSAYDVLLTQRTNETIKLLTVFSVLLLPLTLISGIYGMNISLPLSNYSWSFTLISGLMVLILISMVTIFKFKRWL